MLFLSRPLSWIVLSAFVQAPFGIPSSPAPAKPPLSWGSVAIHATNPSGEGENSSHDQADGITDRGMGLRDIISQGYNFSVMPFRDDEISGLPKWAKNERYDIVARVDPEDVEAFKKLSDLSMQDAIAAFTARQPTGEMLMMQTLLQDRFHVQVHWEMKERSVYALTLAKGGLRIKPAADPKHGEMYSSSGHLSGKGIPLSFLASLLALPVGHTVVDRSGITGLYDFDLRFDPHDNPAGAGSSDPDLFTAVQEQLGLKLQSTHASIPVLIVDHIERPTPN